MAAKEASPREKLYLSAVAVLFKDAAAGLKPTRDEGYRDAMATALARFPDDEHGKSRRVTFGVRENPVRCAIFIRNCRAI